MKTKGLWSHTKTTYRIRVLGFQEGREVTGKTFTEVKREIANDYFMYDKAVYVYRDKELLGFKEPYKVTFKRAMA